MVLSHASSFAARRLLVFFCLATLSPAIATNDPLPPVPREASKADQPKLEFSQVQQLVNSRCIACHSCFDSPCQLNMQSWDGFRRGAFHENVYDGLRLKAVEPTRMFEDAVTERDWREHGFMDVLSGGDDSILVSALRLSALRKKAPEKPVRESLICPAKASDIKTSGKDVSELAMPYGLPALSAPEQSLIANWVTGGAYGKTSLPLGIRSLNQNLQIQIKSWESYLNGKDLKSRVVSRYIYEHLFLASLYFKESPRDFLKLVRSSTPCDEGVHIIPTRRPNEDPGLKNWSYCLYQDSVPVMYKNHLPYEISKKKLAWIKNNFSSPSWKPKTFPSFDSVVAGNPLSAFAEIPVIARYRFLLANADYEVQTFIKGPVCNGSFAVNSIQEQFYVFFINPATDMMVRDPDYARQVSGELILPGELGVDVSPAKILSAYKDILNNRAKARASLAQHLEKDYPKGLTLAQIWDGDGTNDNAVLTVFRHNDNAKVVKGAKGDLSKTAFMLDYSTFERLVYNLAINFDVFGNVSHQLLTRLYMDILRMDAEDNFLQFLPAESRLSLKEQWYKGSFTNWKLDLLNEKTFAKIPSNVTPSKDLEPKALFVQDILFQHMRPNVRGPDDLINWKILKETKNPDAFGNQLKRIAAVRAYKDITPFPNFFPEFSLLLVRSPDKSTQVYSILRNREHQNVSWILDESSRLQNDEDTLTILPGFLGAYPNQFFIVDRAEAEKMVDEILSIRDQKQYREFALHFGISRMDDSMWSSYDRANEMLTKLEPVESGYLDLSRYEIKVRE